MSDSKSGSARRPRFLIGALVAALVGSNLWWAYLVVDAGAAQADVDENLRRSEESLDRALGALLVAARPGASRDQILAAARLPRDASAKLQLDEEGFVWIGRLGLRFDSNGRLVAARKGWD